MEVKNILLDKFFDTFQLNKNGLQLYCRDNNIENYLNIIEEFEMIRTEIYNHLWEITKPNKRLFPDEIIKESDSYFKDNYQWINESGKKAVNNYLSWMCWHEGIMKT